MGATSVALPLQITSRLLVLDGGLGSSLLLAGTEGFSNSSWSGHHRELHLLVRLEML